MSCDDQVPAARAIFSEDDFVLVGDMAGRCAHAVANDQAITLLGFKTH
jgi:hypothetical protein